ncbi:MAG: hypothetical protein QOJ06_235 [Pseudonocardiales bacterium]|jgi:hypothetical protein|nr:hypothetical protein [Pseudonocardiales bacterium]
MPSLDPNSRPGSLRVSDAEREQVAARIRDAAERGMLTLAEADERQAAAYAAKVRADLAGLTDDLPSPATERSGEPNLSLPLQPMVRRRLAVHAALAVVLATALIVRWALGPVPWFWPAGPMFWLAVSLVLHYRWVRHRRVPSAPAHHTLATP